MFMNDRNTSELQQIPLFALVKSIQSGNVLTPLDSLIIPDS